jgi:hypothetical protein
MSRIVMNIASIVLIATDPSFINGSYILLSNNVSTSFFFLVFTLVFTLITVRGNHRSRLRHHLDTAPELEQT